MNLGLVSRLDFSLQPTLVTPSSLLVAAVETEITRVSLFQPTAAAMTIQLHIDEAGGTGVTNNTIWYTSFDGTVPYQEFVSPAPGSGIMLRAGDSLVIAGSTNDDVIVGTWGVLATLLPVR